MIAAKRERYAQALCAYSLLAATLQMAVWFMWNSSLYVVSLIYRLNQSKVYIWRILCTFPLKKKPTCLAIAFREEFSQVQVHNKLKELRSNPCVKKLFSSSSFKNSCRHPMQFEASVSLQKRVVNTTKVMTLQQTVYIRPLSRNYIKVREVLPRLQKHVLYL